MTRFRSILLSGLVALLMVGFVQAGDVDQASKEAVLEGGINIYMGTWDASMSDCLPAGATDCIKIGISFDFSWLKDLFN